MRTVLLLLCLLSCAEALAQPPPPEETPPEPVPLAGLSLELGQPLRILSRARLLEGRLLELDARLLTLVDSSQVQRERIVLTEVQELSVRQRSAPYGALVGAGVGLLTGALVGTYVCGFADYSTYSGCLGIAGLVGAVFALPGAGLGALIGLLIPHWALVYQRHPSDEKNWQLGLLVSSIFGLTSPLSTLNPGARVQGLAQLGPHFAVGGELALHYLVQSLYRFPAGSPVLSFGVLMRVVPRPGVIAPVLLAGGALHPADSVRPGRYSLGVGLDRHVSGALPLSVELRWHHSGIPWSGKGWLMTLDVGTRFFR